MLLGGGRPAVARGDLAVRPRRASGAPPVPWPPCAGRRPAPGRRRPAASARRARRRRYSRNTGRSLVTTGRSALIASSTARPKPSFTDGKASASAARYQAAISASRHRAEQDDVAAQGEPEPVERGQRVRRGTARSPGRSARRSRPAPTSGRVRSRSRASASNRWMLPLRGSIPPTARNRKRSAAPTRARSSARRLAGIGANRATSTPLCTTCASTPNSARSRSRQTLADHEHRVGLEDGLPLAVDQGRGGEVVDVVHGAHDPRPDRPRPGRAPRPAPRCSPACARARTGSRTTAGRARARRPRRTPAARGSRRAAGPARPCTGRASGR